MHTEVGTDASATMHQDASKSPKLTFAALDARIDALPESPGHSTILPKTAKWGYAIAIAGALLALLSVKLLPDDAIHTAVLGSLGVIVELAGVAAAAISQMPKRWPTFAHARREFAEQLDFDLPHHLALVDWLRTFPLDQRKELGEFVACRHARMKEKLPMLAGSIEKLGALPIVIALYLQFKDMRWPPHPSWLEIFLIFALVFGYWTSLLLINIRFRLQTYDMLLKRSLARTAMDWNQCSGENEL